MFAARLESHVVVVVLLGVIQSMSLDVLYLELDGVVQYVVVMIMP